MHGLLRFAGVYNIVAGLSMMVLYHEGFKALGLPKPEFNMPIQLVGVLVAIFGVGYLMVDRNPVENRNVLLLGFLSKFLGPLLAFYYIANGQLPLIMLVVLFFADIMYWVPFGLIYRRLCKALRNSGP
jgi:CDP-diglyceride synthetase